MLRAYFEPIAVALIVAAGRITTGIARTSWRRGSMTFEELIQHAHTKAPVCCADAAMGLVIRPSGAREVVGVQVPGEEDIRWVRFIDLVDLGGGAIVELQPLSE